MWKEYPLNKNYLVSKDGRIKSKRRNKELTPKENWDGYHRIQIWDSGKCNMISWHRVVAITYIPNPDNKPVVNHKDGNKTNNHVDNLEWVTQSENIQHSWNNGLSVKQFNCESTSREVIQLKNNVIVARYPSICEAARQTGLGRSNISFACNNLKQNGTLRVVGGYNWKHADKTSND